MLVITRKQNEKIIIPTLGIKVQVLELTKRAVKIGIDAPPEVKILREEVSPQMVCEPARSTEHKLANALNRVTLAIHLARKQWAAGFSKEAERNLENALAAVEGLENEQKAPRRRYSALVVDDDSNERELLAGLLGMNGCECATAADGEDALSYLDAGGRPDVVLLDLAMPRCDGVETLRRIRSNQNYSGLRVFSVSGSKPTEVNIPEGQAGFDAWFQKPLDPSRLWAAIQATARN